MMKRTFGVLLAATLGLGALAGCGAPASAPASSGAAPAGPIKIGLNFELSGAVATYGQAEAQGAEMAIEEINKAGGIKGQKIELVKYDTKSDQAEAKTLATKLMTQDKVLAVIGPATSGGMKAVTGEALKYKVPVVSGSATDDSVTVDASGVKEYIFRTCFNDSFQGTAMANYALKKLSAKSAAVIKDSSSDYAKGLAENFKKTFTAAGGTIVSESAYVAKDTDFNAILTALKSKQFDVIYVPGYYNEVGLIIKQARSLGITAPILGGDGFDSPKLAELAGAGNLAKVFFTNHYSAADKDPVVTKFVSDFKAKYNAEPNAFHALGYDTAKFVVDAISRATALNGEAVKVAMAGTKNFVGVTGTFSIDANHNPVKAVVIIGLDANGKEATAEKAATA